MNGVILVNKEKGISSFGVVAKIRKILGIKKVGHCGTLDPEAEGVLPIMVGNATKISKYLVEHDKEYVATVKFGIKTDSADSEGNVIQKSNFILNKNDEKIYYDKISELIGKRKQIPPMYSAIKVNGKKLYEYAREGVEIKREARDIEIYSIEILEINYNENEITFKVKCSKGTYIRTLCEEIAEKIETIGFMKSLIRTKLDNFVIENSFKISEIENLNEINKCIISIEEIFSDVPNIVLNNKKIELFLNGVMLTQKNEDGLYKIYNDDKFIGLGVVKNCLLKRDVIV